MKWGAITVPTEEQLQLYEHAPLQYRNEVKDARKRIEKRFEELMNSHDRRFEMYDSQSKETTDDMKEDCHIHRIWTRLINLTIKIDRYEYKEFMKQYGYVRRQTQRTTAIQPATNVDALVRKVEQDAAMQMMRLFPVHGEA